MQNQFGGSAGGPILKNRSLFSAITRAPASPIGRRGYQTWVIRIIPPVPTAAHEARIFSSLLGPSYTGTDVNGAPIIVVERRGLRSAFDDLPDERGRLPDSGFADHVPRQYHPREP